MSDSNLDSNLDFKDYLFYNRFNRSLLIVVSVLIILQISIFKYYYPFAGFINGDSYAYINSAFYNLRADTYPIGYPKFLRLFSVFSYNDTCLVVFQYLLIQFGLLSILFSIFYFYDFNKGLKVSTMFFCVLNPVLLYLANYICSDSLFLGLSLLWFAILIWTINRLSLKIIILHTILIVLLFTIRYNALFYPFISLITLFLNRNRLGLKLLGLGVAFLLILIFIDYTSNQFKRISGIKQFTPFSGWQIANNALYAYRFVDSSKRKELPDRFREIDQTVRNYFDSTRDLSKHPIEMLYASTVYMWDPRSPLRIYMREKFKSDTAKKELKMWAEVAPLYSDYGKTLILEYPDTFLENYLWPNFLKYYTPPVEFLNSYSTGVDTIPPLAKQWFWYKSNKLKTRTKDLSVNALNFYPILLGVVNVIFLSMSIALIFLIKIRISDKFCQLWILTISFWITNLIFSVFASPVALRFQLFPFFISLIFSHFLLDRILKIEPAKDKNTT